MDELGEICDTIFDQSTTLEATKEELEAEEKRKKKEREEKEEAEKMGKRRKKKKKKVIIEVLRNFCLFILYFILSLGCHDRNRFMRNTQCSIIYSSTSVLSRR